MTRSLDLQRKLSEDLAIITAWFKTLQKTIKEYEIHPDNITNMDEKGFMIGVAASAYIIQHRAYRNTFIT